MRYFIIFVLIGFIVSCTLTPQHLKFSDEKVTIEDLNPVKMKHSIVSINTQGGRGSGFFVARNMIATNLHNVVFPGVILAKSTDNHSDWSVDGVVAYDMLNDLVILKIAGEGTPLSLGDSNDVRIDEPVFAVGYSKGNYKVTEGNVRRIRNSDKWLVMRINTSGGSSGSAVLNQKGQVVGVDVAGFSPSYSYAIPSNVLRALLSRSKSAEPLEQWQKKKQVNAFHYYT